MVARQPCATALACLLLAALAGGALGADPLPKQFANPGGPPFLFIGLAYLSNATSGFGALDGAVGVFQNGTYALQRLLPDGVHVERGRFLSWQCAPDAPVNGTYQALVELVTERPDGSKSEPRVVCQTGMIDLDIKRGPWLDWGQSEEECPHYTNLSFELFSWEHIKRLRLANTCGDASPDPLAPEEGDGVEDGSIVPDDVSTAADGGEDGEAPPAPDGGSQLVQPSSRVLGDGGAATRPFTPGREPEPPQP